MYSSETIVHISIPVDQMWPISSLLSLKIPHFTSLWRQRMETTHDITTFRTHSSVSATQNPRNSCHLQHLACIRIYTCQLLSWTGILICLAYKPWRNQKVTPQQIHIRHFLVTHAAWNADNYALARSNNHFPITIGKSYKTDFVNTTHGTTLKVPAMLSHMNCPIIDNTWNGRAGESSLMPSTAKSWTLRPTHFFGPK